MPTPEHPPVPDDDDAPMRREQDDARLAAAWLALQAQHRRADALAAELAAVHDSRSWRLTAPLRALRARIAGPANAPPTLQPPGTPTASPQPAASDILRARLSAGARVAPASEAGVQYAPALYVDVTEVALCDHGGGIPRVVRRLLTAFLLAPPAGMRVEPVRLAADGRYVLARGFLADLLGLAPGEAGVDAPIAARAGDCLLGLDLVRDRAAIAGPAWAALRAAGARVAVVAYDLLPRTHPEWFPPGVGARFADWLGQVQAQADQVLCISGTVAAQWRALPVARADGGPAVRDIVLGADLEDWLLPHPPLPPRRQGQPRFVLVGTLEPRKGHAQALAAFERLWARGGDAQLLILGRAGWGVDALVGRLREHPQRGRLLHWIEQAADAELAAAYRSASALLAPSLDEGFGLPLAEAAAFGLPVLARDLPVFREVAGDRASYFSGTDPDALATAVTDWIARDRDGGVPLPAPAPSWRDSARSVLGALGLAGLPRA
jgi:glycosyltransferase involved in cell wall biosynthesis